jgi:tetratricopeptide (TPR) repeat protein
MRKMNGKLFLALLIGAAVLSGGLVAVHAYQYQRVARALLWQARKAEQDGQIARMAQYLQRYLEFNPRDHAEKATLAKAWTGETFAGSARARRGAVLMLDEVLTYEDNPDLRRLLVKTAVEMGDYKRARDHLARLLSWADVEKVIAEEKALRKKNAPLPARLTKEDPARGELEGYWGQILEQDKKPAPALACYRLAVRHAPEMLPSYIRLAHLLRRFPESDPLQRKENLAEADRTIDTLVKRNDTMAEAYLARWRYRREFDQMAIREAGQHGQISLEKSAEDIAEALKRKPGAVEVLLAAADLERLRGRAAGEDPALDTQQRRAGMKAHRDLALGHLEQGLTLVKSGKVAASENAEFHLLWHKGNLLLDDLELRRVLTEEDGVPPGDVTAMKEEIGRVIELVRKSRVPSAADYMRGRLFAHERNWAQAATLFERARAMMGSQPDLACQADLYLGQCYERLEEHTQMYNAFKRVAEWDPTSVPAQLGMAAARWAQGQLDNARTFYDVVMKQKRVPARGWIDIARLELQRQVQSARPNWTDAENALVEAEKYNKVLRPRALLEVHLLRAEVLSRQGKMPQARKELETAIEATPEEPDLWTALADLALRQNDTRQARKTLDEACAKLGDRVSLRLAEARFCLATKDPQAKAHLATLSDNRERFSEDDQARLLSGLADAHLRAGDEVMARRLWEAMAQLPRQRNDLRLRLLLFDLAMKAQDDAAIRKTLEDIQAVEQGHGPYHRYGQALLLISQAEKKSARERGDLLRKARAELDRVQTQRPSWPAVFLARARIAELNGDDTQAIREWQEAFKNGERGAGVLRQLAAKLLDRGDNGTAEMILVEAQRAAHHDRDLGRLDVWLALRKEDYGRAIERARELVRADSKNPQELMWIGRVNAAAGKPKEAEKKFDEAIQHAGKDPAPWVVKVQFLVEQKRRDEALELIEKAQDQLPPEQRALALGLCHDAVRDAKKAQAYYKEALKANPEDLKTVRTIAVAHLGAGRAAAARPLLEQIIDDKVKGAAEEDRAWARRSLALVLAGGTDYREFEKALALVGLKLDGNGRLPAEAPGTAAPGTRSTEMRRAQARVLASQQSQSQFRHRAIELLEDLGRQNALSPDDQFVLALLLDAEGRPQQAKQRLSDLAKLETRTPPQYLAQYAMSLIVRWHQPDDLAKAERVIGWLEDLEQQREVEPNTFASVELKARLLETRRQGDEALLLLRKHAAREKAKPEEVLLVLASLSRQRRFAEAFNLCEKTWKAGKCATEAVGGVSVALLRVMKPSDAQVKAVEDHLLEAVKKKPRATVLKMHLSDLYDMRGRYDQAVAMYRRVLKEEPNNVVALNNLAWLLAHGHGSTREALEHIDRAVNGMGRRADLLDTRGLVHLALGDTAKALADLEEATSEGPSPSRLFHLARAYHAQRNEAKAREALRKAAAKGLQVNALHPVEQKACVDLVREHDVHLKEPERR